jgi:hypothetical protein
MGISLLNLASYGTMDKTMPFISKVAVETTGHLAIATMAMKSTKSQVISYADRLKNLTSLADSRSCSRLRVALEVAWAHISWKD